jgi:hypothetical protein
MRISKPLAITLVVATTSHFALHCATSTEDVGLIAQRILTQMDAELRVAELDGAMASFDAIGQAELLRRLFRDGDPPTAAHAFVMLIQRDAVDDATRDLLGLEIRDWLPGLQLSAISVIGSRPDAEERRRYADVIRTAKEVALARNDVGTDRERLRLIDSSILALARMDDPHATADAKNVIQRMPDSGGAWIVLLDSGAVGDEERAIARGILDDGTRKVPLRVLAAITLGDAHAPARAYVELVVNGIVDEFEETTLREMMVSSMSAPSGDPARRRYVEFLESAKPVLSSLSLVRDGSLDTTLRRCAGARNEMIRDSARYAIAAGSPHLVLEEPPCIVDPALRLETAAAAAILHPEMQGNFEQRFGVAELGAAMERVRGVDGSVILGEAVSPLPFAH